MTASIFLNLIDSLFYTYFGLQTTLNGKYFRLFNNFRSILVMFGLPWPFNRQTKSYKERRQPEENYYRTQYRFDVSVQWMSDHFLELGSGEKRGGALSNKQKMEVCLRYMADPGFQRLLEYPSPPCHVQLSK